MHKSAIEVRRPRYRQSQQLNVGKVESFVVDACFRMFAKPIPRRGQQD
jgi:hypothetical protein